MNPLRHLIPTAVAVAAVCPACMLSPEDGETIGSTSSTVVFEGFDYASESDVRLEVHNPSSGGFDPLITVQTGDTPYRYDGADWYSWNHSQSIPGTYWRAGPKGGHYAKVRAIRGSGGSFSSVTPGWGSCRADHPGVSDFINHCTSSQSPNANIYTSAFPGTIDLVVDNLIFTPSGTTIYLTNAGRAGKIVRAECSSFSRGMTRTYSQAIGPGESTTIRMSFTPTHRGERITCTVYGEDTAREPEPVSCTTSGGITRCGDNSRTEVF